METRRRLLGGILTLVCFALCSGIADAACRDTAFSCKDGSKCLLIYRKCNGVAQCRDRSDEDPDMCGKAATARIALGEVLRAKVQYKAEHESVQFILCDGSSCGGFDVEGATSGGDLAFTSSEDENPMGDYGNEVNSSRPSDFHVFPTGELLFEVERRLHEVVVWLSGHKDKSISAPVKQNSSLLRVKPLAWHSDMPVELSVQQNVCGEYGFLCANGQCRQITDKCDGVKQCADGSDEDVAMCNSSVSGACGKGKFECKNKECKPIGVRCDGRKDCSDGSDEDLVICNTADSTDIHLGAVLTTKVQYKPEHEAIEFHLCGGQRCGVLRVMGVGSTGQLAYKSFTGANAMGAYGTLHSEKGPAQWVHWPADEVVFEVERRLTDMAVWLRGHNDSKVSVPATEDSSLLRVRPAVWGSNMHAQFTSSPNACGDFGFPCANGECRPVTDKCNGVPQCSDRSDEYTDLCDSIPETTLSVGDSRSVHVQHKKSHGAIYFTLCEEKSCKTVDILGSAPSGALDYVTYTCPGASKFFGCTEAQRV